MKYYGTKQVVLTVIAVLITIAGVCQFVHDSSIVKYKREDYREVITAGDSGDSGSFVLDRTMLDEYKFNTIDAQGPDKDGCWVYRDTLFQVAYPEERIGAVQIELSISQPVTMKNVLLTLKFSNGGSSSTVIERVIGDAISKVMIDLPDGATVEGVVVDNIEFESFYDGSPEYYEVGDSVVELTGQNSIRSKKNGTAIIINKYGYVTDVVHVKKGKITAVGTAPIGVYLEE